jgi:hypothetical protein
MNLRLSLKKKFKPYLKKIGKYSGFIVWFVDGNYIRTFINEEFTNFGQHYRFKFIPKDEFWIDKENSNNEVSFYIDHLLIENYLMKKGKSYDYAINKADSIEKRERKKSKFYIRTFKRKRLCYKEIINKIHIRLLKSFSKKISVFIVNGELVRDKFFIDFTEGGHDKVYHFVPKNEIWLDNDLTKKERDYVLLHEVHERNLMAKGFSYEKAHRSSSRIEYYCRHHPFKIRKLLKKEFGKISS